MPTAFAAVLFALISGCSGEEVVGGSDSEGSSGGEAAEPVRYSAVKEYRPLVGESVDVSENPADAVASIDVRSGGEAYSGEYDGKAWLVFDGVPEGAYELHSRGEPDPDLQDDPGFYAVLQTDARVIYEGAVFSGRPDVEVATSAATSLLLSADGMAPLGDVDSFELYSYNTDAIGTLDPFDEFDPAAPSFGDTEFTEWLVPWDVTSSRGGDPLIDPDAGDDLWLAHLRGGFIDIADFDDPWYGAYVYTLSEAAPLSLAPMGDGATTHASGTFAAVATKPLSVDLRTSEFLAELVASVPNPEIIQCSADVLLEPGVDLPVYGYLPSLGGVSTSTSAPLGDRVLDVEYGDPYPIGTESLFIRCIHWLQLAHPTEGDTDYTMAFIDAVWPVSQLDGGPLRPLVGAVQGLTLGGEPAPVDAVRTGLGTTPTVTFGPPTLGSPDIYVVRIYRVDNLLATDGTVGASRHIALSVVTTNTSVAVPEGVLEVGAYYYVQVRAAIGHKPGAGRPHSHVSGGTSVTTGLFTP